MAFSTTANNRLDRVFWTASLDAAGSSAPLRVPVKNIHGIFVGVTAAGGATGYAEYSGSDPDLIAAGSGVWHKWPQGDVTTEDSETILPGVTAIRFTQSGAGTVVGEVSY